MHPRGISIRRVTALQDLKDVQNIHREVWGLDDIDVHPVHMLIGIQKSNGLVLCAYHNEQPIGMFVSYCGLTEDSEPYLHCHNIAVLKKYRNTGVGCQLLLQAREYMCAHGIQLARATFDPLESHNASFYFGKAGCTCNKYCRNYYGPILHHGSKGIPSDRLSIEYHMNGNFDDRSLDGAQLEVGNEMVMDSEIQILNGIKINRFGSPIPEEMYCDLGGFIDGIAKRLYMEIPSNHQEIKIRIIENIIRWRYFLREKFEECFALGLVVSGFVCSEGRCFYILSLPRR